MALPALHRASGVTRAALFALAYAFVALPSLYPWSATAPPLWPAAGVGLAGLMLLGVRAWPALAAGSLLASLLSGSAISVALAIAAGNTAAATTGALLLQAGRCDRALGRLIDVLQFIVLGALVGPMISAGTLAVTFAVHGDLLWRAVPEMALARWLAEVMGTLAIGPLILATVATPRAKPTAARVYEGVALVVSLLTVTHVVYGGWLHHVAEQPFAFTVFPFIVWAVLRFEQRDALGATVLGIAAALLESAAAGTPLRLESASRTFLLAQTSMAVVMLTALILSAAIAERRRMAIELLEGRANLEFTVRERTRQLEEELAERVRVEDVLHRYEFIVNTSGQMMTLINRDYVYEAVNNWFCLSYGRTREEIVGKAVTDIWGKDVFERHIRERLEGCFAGETSQYQAWLPLQGTGLRCMEMSTTPYRNPAGAITHAVVVSWDVTDREMMAEHLLKLSSAVEQSPVAIIITDTLGDIEYVNPRFVRTTGYALEEVRGRNPRLLKSGETAAGEYRRLWQTITAGGEWRGEFHNRKKNGELFWEFALISPIRNADGQITHFLGVKEDITARKRLERELLEKNKELEQIVYVTSHDLRSPLVNIQGFAKELNRSFLDLRGALGGTQVPADLAEAIGPILEQEIPEAFSYVFASTRKMDALIDGLLRLSRLGRATMMLRPIAMDQLVASIVQTFEYVLQQRGIDVHVEPLPPCLGDEMQINQLFSNLFDNAIKYLDPGRPGRITVSGARTGRVSRYLVADNGIGIDPQHAERIFDIFHRLHPDLVEGEGLGLTIARKIVERHGGTVRVESVPGTGSTFAVTLPAPPSDRSL